MKSADGGQKYINIVFAKEFDVSIREKWKLDKFSGTGGVDSVEYLYLAASKWAYNLTKDRVAQSQKEMLRKIGEEPQGEVLGMLIASASWFKGKGPLGFCQFRRTWCNNVVFDFLAIHPLLQTKERPVTGVGSALLAGLSEVTKALQANSVWAKEEAF